MEKLRTGLKGTSGGLMAGAAVAVVLGLVAFILFGRGTPGSTTPVAVTQPQTEDVAVAPPAEQSAAAPTASVAQTATNEPQVSAVADATPGPEEENAPEPTAPTVTDAPRPDPQPGEAASAGQADAPAFDEVRREPDGMTVIAGRAAPGAAVKLLQNGVEIATATADTSGKFAALAVIPPDGQGHVLSLLQTAEGRDTPSDDQIILAPTAAPQKDVPVATDADPDTDPDQQVQTASVADTQSNQETETAAVDTGAGEQAAPAAEPVTAQPLPTEETLKPVPAEPATVAVLKSTAEGVELLNTPSPDAMTSVELDTISYSDAGDVQLSGRAPTSAQSVRVYLDNDAVVNLPVDGQGRWRGDLPDVDEGIYTLRVDELAADGTVSSRVETPFKRESPTLLAAAAATQASGPISSITVQKGNTLWAIARDRYGDGLLYVRVFEANQKDIRDPDLIYPGQVFDLPD